MAENISSIFTEINISIANLQKLGKVTEGLNKNLSALGRPLVDIGTKLKDLGKITYPKGTILDQFGKPLVSKVQASSTAVRNFGTRLVAAGQSLRTFGQQMSTTLGIALRWYIAYRAIRAILGGITKGFQDMKALQIEGIFTEAALAGEKMESVLRKTLPLAQKWGVDNIETYRAVLQFARALGDMYEMDLPRAMALTDVAMKVTIATGQNLNESISNMVGYIRILGVESVKDIDKFMSVLYAAAFRTNEALTRTGQQVKGGALAMDILTDAVQRMLPSMVRFGLSWEQIASIASIFITNLDEAGQGIGAYSAKLFEAIKGNQKLRDIYKDVNVELTRQEGELIPALLAGYLKMTDAQRDVASSATSIGIGAHIVAVFWESLEQIMARTNDIKNKSNLLDSVAVKMMSTLQKKQDQLRVSMQALNIQVMKAGLPAFTGFVDILTKTVKAVEWTGESVGTTAAQIATSVPLMLKQIWAGWTGQEEKFKKLGDQIEEIGRITDESLLESFEKVYGLNKELIEQYMDMTLEMNRMFAAKRRGMTADDILILEDAKRVINEYSMRVKIATGALGLFASKQEISRVKTELLREELQKLDELMDRMPSELAKLEIQVRISEINKQLDETETHYGNIVELAEKLANTTKEGPPTLGEMVQKTRDLSRQFEDISVRGMKGILDKTKTWRNILEDIGEVVLEEILRKIIRISIGAESSFNWLGALSSTFGIITGFGGLGGAGSGGAGGVPSTGGARTQTVMTHHQGGEVKKQLPSFQYGGEVPIMAKPGEFVVAEGPAQRNMELLKAINAGRDGGGGGQAITYTIYAVDARSFQQLLYQNKASIHGIVQEASRVNKVGFRNMER